jgi:hypothetical protein
MIGFILDRIESHLRTKFGTTYTGRQIELQWDGRPSLDVSSPFIGISDHGETNTSSPSEMVQRITTNISISIWSRSRPMPPDMLYDDLRSNEKYRDPYNSLDELRMLVVKHVAGSPGRWELYVAIRDYVKAHCADFDEVPLTPLIYVSASAPEMYTPPQSDEGHFETMQPGWVGRRLMFAGLTRLVSLR